MMKMPALLLALCVACAASAQEYPTRLVRIIVASAPGGPVDITARVIGQKLSDRWGQSVIVENRVGASEMIGTAAAAKAAPDGYTLLVVANPFTVNPAVFSKLPYDPVRSFTTITMLTQTPMVLVANPKAPFNTVQELIAEAKTRPGALAWASAGNATMNHITGEHFASEAGIKLLHVPYKDGSPAAANAVMAGDTQFGIVGLNSALPFVKSGRLKVLAVTTEKRTALAPELPTLAESGVQGIDTAVRVGMYAPAGTPQPVVAKLNAEVNRILTEPATRQQLANLGAEVYGGMSPEDHERMITRIAAQIAKVVAQANIKVE
jgi:tripartite-type tricarboxylate transporter receptor subunit TctC